MSAPELHERARTQSVIQVLLLVVVLLAILVAAAVRAGKPPELKAPPVIERGVDVGPLPPEGVDVPADRTGSGR